MKRTLLLLALVAMVGLPAARVTAAEGWSFEVIPYAWMVGIDADVTVGGRTANADVGFDDILDNFDGGAEIAGIARYQRWVLIGQFDYLGIDSDSGDDASDVVRVEMDSFIWSAAAGYQFDGFVEDSTIDVLVGARGISFDTTLSLKVGATGDRSETVDAYDAIIMVRPAFRLSEKWRFDIPLAIGGGDSDLVYELQPEFQYAFNEQWSGCFGYRYLHYDVEDDKGKFDGSFSGAILGVSVSW